jgi:hypothetical protein
VKAKENVGVCKCGQPRRGQDQRYCRDCHNAHMRAWRPSNPLMGEARKRANVRSIAHVYRDRGHIKREGCRICGKEAEMHHPDYGKPREVEWLCREHHLELHDALKRHIP